MLFLMLAIASSLAIGALFKHAGRVRLDRLLLLTVNYVVASVMGFGLLLRQTGQILPPADPGFLLLASATGLVLIGSFFVFALATEKAGMSISMAVMRVGVAIPFVVSWLLWNEQPTAAQWSGLVLVAVALFLITRAPDATAPAPGTGLAAVAGVLLLLFLGGGAGDTLIKAFDVWFGESVPGDAFMAVAFGVSFLVGLVLVLRSGSRRWDPATVLWGAVLGAVNYASILFVLEAVARIPATIVFPTISVSVVVGGALLGVAVWKERLSRVNLAGVALAAVAVLLLNA